MWGGSAQSGSGANLKISAFVLVMSTVLESIRRLFQAHQARLAAVAAAPGVGPLSGSLREISATCLSKQIQDLVKPQPRTGRNKRQTFASSISGKNTGPAGASGRIHFGV